MKKRKSMRINDNIKQSDNVWKGVAVWGGRKREKTDKNSEFSLAYRKKNVNENK